VDRLITPQPLASLGVGTMVALAASAINLVVARILLHVGRKHHSIVLEADGQHLMSDVWTSVGVVAGLFLVWLLGPQWSFLDPILALIVAANIVWTAYDLLRRSFDGLMDHALPQAEQAAVRQAIAALLLPEMHFHALRTRQAGARRFVDFHLLVPGAWSVSAAHDWSERIEAAIRAALPAGAEVVVHIEPIEAGASWHDSELLQIEAPHAP
jgi:cation diffusion facilitator family transporter